MPDRDHCVAVDDDGRTVGRDVLGPCRAPIRRRTCPVRRSGPSTAPAGDRGRVAQTPDSPMRMRGCRSTTTRAVAVRRRPRRGSGAVPASVDPPGGAWDGGGRRRRRARRAPGRATRRSSRARARSRTRCHRPRRRCWARCRRDRDATAEDREHADPRGRTPSITVAADESDDGAGRDGEQPAEQHALVAAEHDRTREGLDRADGDERRGRAGVAAPVERGTGAEEHEPDDQRGGGGAVGGVVAVRERRVVGQPEVGRAGRVADLTLERDHVGAARCRPPRTRPSWRRTAARRRGRWRRPFVHPRK